METQTVKQKMKKVRYFPSWMKKGHDENQSNAANIQFESSYTRYKSKFAYNKQEEISPEEQRRRINQNLRELNYLSYENKIYYLSEYDEIRNAAQEILDWLNNIKEDGQIPVGFDMEWPFSYQTGPYKTALIQFSFSLDVCYLFQVWKLDTLPKSLVELIHHEKLLLHGICIKNDIRKLGRDFPNVGSVDKLVANCCDLGLYANKVLGINEQTGINKDKAVRASQWDKMLSEEQKIYAAIDVYASQLIFRKIKEKEEKRKTEAQINHLLTELEVDFKKEHQEEKDNEIINELRAEYENLKRLLESN
uniref:3'-5' exonuclease n=1 Tax=Culicoides sonorensis TaxID=179676 RepID=A0A336MNT8_CULSO